MTKLNLGSGDLEMPGWINLDALPYPNVDRVLDLTRGIPYQNVSFIYAEHFVEHLTPDQSMALLRACRRSLADDGILRLSTPNLDWVLETHYRPQDWRSPTAAVDECFALNKGFHGWGHRFLFNHQTLEAFLLAAGFAKVAFFAYGVSTTPELTGLERHERSVDTERNQHVLIAQASGRSDSNPEWSEQRIAYRRDAGMPYHVLQYSLLWFIRGLSRTARFLFPWLRR